MVKDIINFKGKIKIYSTYRILIGYFVFFILFGFIMATPKEIIIGLKNIIIESDILITDYFMVGGIGASFVNSGLLGLICIFILIKVGIKPNGATIAALWLVSGFAFFGKNIINVWPIMLGVWLYSKYQKEPFLNYVLISLFGTTLAPTLNELSFIGIFPIWFSIILGVIISIFIGFILPPVAAYCMKLHQGYNLYNTGFAAGLIATILMSVFRAFNIDFKPRLLWSTGNNLLFSVVLFILFSSMIILGFLLNNKSFNNLNKIFRHSGRLITDFFLLYGEGACLINMGILGFVSTGIILLINGDLNGPTIGGIFTVMGFGTFGKHVFNVLPVMAGSLLSSSLNIWPVNSPSIQLATLFCTTLAPISGQFGWWWGIIAGFLHVCTVMNMGYLHGGLNLYNNGFGGGIVAIILIPIITALRKDEEH